MRLGRLVATGAAAALVAGFGIAGAAPASADGTLTGCTDTSAGSGGDITVTYPHGCTALTGFLFGSNLEPGSGALAFFSIPGGTVTSVNVYGSYVILHFTDGSCDYAQPVYAPGASGVPNPAVTDCSATTPSADAPPPIPAWVQAYARDGKDATCEDGWSPSWQKWAEDVSGGWVCTRTIPSLG